MGKNKNLGKLCKQTILSITTKRGLLYFSGNKFYYSFMDFIMVFSGKGIEGTLLYVIVLYLGIYLEFLLAY